MLVDSPPFPLVTDALIIAGHADGILTVLRPGNTRRSVATEHLRRLAAATGLLGIVINDSSAGSHGAGYGYGYGYGASQEPEPPKMRASG